MASHCIYPCVSCGAAMPDDDASYCDLCARELAHDLERDARVKDAAHDLLAACKQLLDHSGTFGGMAEAHRAVEAAVAKAEGNGA